MSCSRQLLLTIESGNDISSLNKSRLRPNFLNLLDHIDLKILYILQNDGRRRLADIADEVALSAPAVMERVKKLEASGVIKGYLGVSSRNWRRKFCPKSEIGGHRLA